MACGKKVYREGSYDNVIIKIISFLTGKGFTFMQACAVCGNVFQESGYVVNAINSSSKASGLFQWLGSRKKNLLKAAQKQGKSWIDIDIQLDFLWEELNGPEKATLNWFQSHRTETLETMTKKWTILFERCGEGEYCFNNRVPEAERCSKTYTNYADGIVASGDSGSSGGVTVGTDIDCLDLSHATAQNDQNVNESQSGVSTTGFSGRVTNPKMKLVLSKLDYFYNYGGTKGDCKAGTFCRIKEHNYLNKCTYGPTTFYKNAGIDLYFWCGVTGSCNGQTGYPLFPTFNCIKKRMDKYGFYLAGHWDFDEARNNPNSIYRPGDVATLACSPCGAHALMWTGFDWRSDAIEKNICSAYPNQHKGKFGNYSVCIWRRADCQEPGLDTTPVPCTIC